MNRAAPPWDASDPFTKGSPVPEVKILWDYEAQVVIDAGNVSCGLFDTLWTFTYRHGSKLPWVLSRFPGDVFYRHEDEVPELVRLALLVAS